MVSYINPDITTSIGQVKEINIPAISDLEDIDTYTTNLVVPVIFGEPSITTPNAYTSEITKSSTSLPLEKTSPAEGISMLFGNRQIMAFNLQYHLENPTVNTALTQIALPPDTAYQKMFYDKIEPKPEKIERDIDGNWIATYQLKPRRLSMCLHKEV